jgi:hypothetical protein
VKVYINEDIKEDKFDQDVIFFDCRFPNLRRLTGSGRLVLFNYWKEQPRDLPTVSSINTVVFSFGPSSTCRFQCHAGRGQTTSIITLCHRVVSSYINFTCDPTTTVALSGLLVLLRHCRLEGKLSIQRMDPTYWGFRGQIVVCDTETLMKSPGLREKLQSIEHIRLIEKSDLEMDGMDATFSSRIGGCD